MVSRSGLWLQKMIRLSILVAAVLAPHSVNSQGSHQMGFAQFNQAMRETEVSLDRIAILIWTITYHVSEPTKEQLRDYGWGEHAGRIGGTIREVGEEVSAFSSLKREISWWEGVAKNPERYVNHKWETEGLSEIAYDTRDTLYLMLELLKIRDFYVEELSEIRRNKIPSPPHLDYLFGEVDKANKLIDRIYNTGNITPEMYLEYLKSANCYKDAISLLAGKPRGTPMPGDVWLGEWTGKFRPDEVQFEFDYSFTVSRTCSEYEVESLMSGGEEIKVIKIGPSVLEFQYLGESGTNVVLALNGKGEFTGTLDSTTTGGQVEGSVRE